VVESGRLGDERSGRGEVIGDGGTGGRYGGVMARGISWARQGGE
jgi:hypothetical protein